MGAGLGPISVRHELHGEHVRAINPTRTLDAVRRFLEQFLHTHIWITPADLGDCRIQRMDQHPDLVRETVELIPGSRSN